MWVFLVLYTIKKGVVEPINTVVSKVNSIIHTKSEMEPYNLEFKHDEDLDIEVITVGEASSS